MWMRKCLIDSLCNMTSHACQLFFFSNICPLLHFVGIFYHDLIWVSIVNSHLFHSNNSPLWKPVSWHTLLLTDGQELRCWDGLPSIITPHFLHLVSSLQRLFDCLLVLFFCRSVFGVFFLLCCSSVSARLSQPALKTVIYPFIPGIQADSAIIDLCV